MIVWALKPTANDTKGTNLIPLSSAIFIEEIINSVNHGAKYPAVSAALGNEINRCHGAILGEWLRATAPPNKPVSKHVASNPVEIPKIMTPADDVSVPVNAVVTPDNSAIK